MGFAGFWDNVTKSTERPVRLCNSPPGNGAMDFDLPIISGEANPEFADAASCAQWLHALPLINVGPSHGRLLGQLEELNCFAMPVGERMKVLELLREPVVFVQNEHAKKFSAKAVPLSTQEREIFTNVLALWDAFAYGWEHCLQALAGASGPPGEAALACQRALWSLSQKFAEHFKAYQSIAPHEWKRLHRLYAFAEGAGVAQHAVSPASAEHGSQTTCAQTYAHTLLAELANPNQQTPRQQVLVSRWLMRWARKVSFGPHSTPSTGTPALSVDLEAESGASRTLNQGERMRVLQMDDLQKSLRSRIARLRAGESPEALGLGADVPAPLAEQMLLVLHQQWCEDRAARQCVRRATAGEAELCAGLAALHYHLTGQAFRQPVQAKELSQRQREEIATFGRVSSREDDNYVAVQVAALERWIVCDESVTGFRLQRPAGAAQGRYSHRQLIAVRPSDAKVFIACTVHWLTVSTEDALCMGTRLIPGVPRAAAVRPTGINALSEKFVPAICMPAMPALKIPETLLLPAGWYRPKRVIELYLDASQAVLLTSLLERGSNFDRCTFEPAR